MVSMPYGPVLSATYDCFMGDREYWDSWIINPRNYDLALNSSVKVDPDYCPEWENPQGSSYPIHIKSLLMKNGKTKEETDAILEKIREEDDLQVVTQRLS